MEYLKKTFRWFGPSFGVSLADIKEIGAQGIVTACHDIPVGAIWPEDAIVALKREIGAHHLEWSVVESVNVHEAIKYGLPERDTYIANYIQTLKNLAKNNVKVVCYNFMQLIDWTRTNLDYQLPTGAFALHYSPIAAAAFDLCILKREKAAESYSPQVYEAAKQHYDNLDSKGRLQLQNTILAGMPGSKVQIDIEIFKANHQRVLGISKEQLQEHLVYFLRAVIPEAEKLGVKMAIHPDDPPFSVFGVPRIVATYQDIQFVLAACPSPSNGLTLCTGSLGASAENDVLKMIRDFGDTIHFLHLRNVMRQPDGSFFEANHLQGSVAMDKVMHAIVTEKQRRFKQHKGIVAIPIRPDHGHVVLDDKKRATDFYPGYAMIGRAIGLAQLEGLEMGVRQQIINYEA